MEDTTKSDANCVVTKCTLHPDNIVEYFCEKCDTVGCVDCKILVHNQCLNVKHITDIIKDLKIDDSVKELTSNIDSLSVELEHCGNTIESNRHVVSNLHKNAVDKYQHQMTEMREAFDNLEKQTKGTIIAMGQKNQTVLDAAAAMQERLKHTISNIKSDLESRNANENPYEFFIAVKSYETKIRQELNGKIEVLKQNCKIERYEYVPSPAAARDLENLQFGNIEIKTSEQRKGFIFCFTLDIFGDDDKQDHGITELVIVNDSFLVAWDLKTKSIITVDTIKYCIMSKLEGLRPTSFTRISDSQVAVSIPDKNTIQFLNLSQSGILSLGKEIVIKDGTFEQYGIVFCTGMLIAACHTEVRVLDMDGNQIKTITNDTIGKEMFNAAFCVQVSPDGETIYVLDYYSYSNCPSLTSMTLEGKVKAVYKDKDLIKPHALSIDRNGSIFIHCQGQPNVHMLSADCCKVQVMNLQSNCFAFSMKNNTVYVGQEHGIDKYITN